MKRYAIYIAYYHQDDIKIISSTGLVLKQANDFTRLRTSMDYSLQEAQKARDMLIKIGCNTNNLRVEYV